MAPIPGPTAKLQPDEVLIQQEKYAFIIYDPFTEVLTRIDIL